MALLGLFVSPQQGQKDEKGCIFPIVSQPLFLNLGNRLSSVGNYQLPL